MGQQQVVIYVSDDCPHCEALLSFVQAWDISHQLKNVSKSHTAKHELRQLDIYGTPVTFINEKSFLGVPKKRIKQKLGINDAYYFN